MFSSTLFISEVGFATHLREICTVFTSVFVRRACFLSISEVRFSHTSVRSAQFLQQHMRFRGEADLGLCNTKRRSDDTSMARESRVESRPVSGSELESYFGPESDVGMFLSQTTQTKLHYEAAPV